MTTLCPLEPRYRLSFDTRRASRVTTDVLVVGGGVAGLSAALAAAQTARVLVLLKDPPPQSNTALAQGGIAVALDPQDSVAEHAADTLRTGCGLADPQVVERVISEAPRALERLVELGAVFDGAAGRPELGREGGHGRRRIVHARGDATGAECSRVLVDAVRAHPRIEMRAGVFVAELLMAEDRCVGVFALAGEERVAVFARSVILAAGGAGRLYRETSNSQGATGDGIAAAYRAGARLRDMEFVQFHPTTLYLAGTPRVLITEAVRGEGAHIVDDRNRRFLLQDLAEGELAPRDVVSREIVRHLGRPDVRNVYLDLRHLPAERTRKRFPGLQATCARYGLDLGRDRIPVRPAAHYFIGGVICDEAGRSSLPGLYVCGEAACSGLHGANRLASNSLLEGLVLGRRTGAAAAGEGAELSGLFEGELAGVETGAAGAAAATDLEDLRQSLVSLMWRDVGIARDGDGLGRAAGAIASWRRFLDTLRTEGRSGCELANLLTLAALVTDAADRRTESRGTHWRSDHPQVDDCTGRGHWVWERGVPPHFELRPDATAAHASGGAHV